MGEGLRTACLYPSMKTQQSFYLPITPHLLVDQRSPLRDKIAPKGILDKSGFIRNIARVIYVENPARRSFPTVSLHLMRNHESCQRNSFERDAIR